MFLTARRAAGGGVKLATIGFGLALFGGCAYDGLTEDFGSTTNIEFTDHTTAYNSLPVDGGELVRRQLRRTYPYPLANPVRKRAKRIGTRGRPGVEAFSTPEKPQKQREIFTVAFVPSGPQEEQVWWFLHTRDLQAACNALDHPDLGLREQIGFDTDGDIREESVPVKRLAKVEQVSKPKPEWRRNVVERKQHHPPSIRIHPPADIELPTPMLFAP